MEAEEIILQKEWNQLNEEERSLLATLVSDEAEYNLLKKLILVSAEELLEVPEIDPAILARLLTNLKVDHKKRFVWIGYAAASAIIVTLAFWFLLNKGGREKQDKVNEMVQTIPVQKIPRPFADTNNRYDVIQPVDAVKTDEEKEVYKKHRQRTIIRNLHKSDVPETKYTVVINTAIANDTELMAFVTEVY
jgi:hypothetical protein